MGNLIAKIRKWLRIAKQALTALPRQSA